MSYNIIYLCGIQKNGTDELICKTEIETQIYKTDLWIRQGWDELGDWDRNIHTAAAAAKSLQSCPTLCDPIDSSPPGSAVPGILQARTLT